MEEGTCDIMKHILITILFNNNNNNIEYTEANKQICCFT